MSKEVAREILEAFKDPRLCPSLVVINHIPASMRIEDVEAMFEERRRRREEEEGQRGWWVSRQTGRREKRQIHMTTSL